MLNAGDIVTLTPSGFHYVYALIDDDGNVFYIGITNRPHMRLYQHLNPKQSNSADLLWKLHALNEPRMQILSVHSDRDGAIAEERRQIGSRTGLLNQEHRLAGRTSAYDRLPIFEQFRKKDLDRVTGDPVT